MATTTQKNRNYTIVHQLKPEVSRHPSRIILDNRRHHTVINRLRTGNTLLQSSLGKYLKDRRNQTTTCTYCRNLWCPENSPQLEQGSNGHNKEGRQPPLINSSSCAYNHQRWGNSPITHEKNFQIAKL
ncbi:hypothetical protein CHS0354_027246 [Potamilus streckersoni]|uniref:Uncharacterized protein n=1 Tax=Potamilus streckersoni TaxID=2493646 RepID=A0AAE0RXY4_9BIVA|nr:hypothetical protein CHS0354_027246 [Potamilus streckersoni]